MNTVVSSVWVYCPISQTEVHSARRERERERETGVVEMLPEL